MITNNLNLYTENLYYNTHNVEVYTKSGTTESRTVVVHINKQHQCLEVKLRDQNDFAFNFISNIDWRIFDQMKTEQFLEISFEEFHLHFIELLKQTSSKEMLLKLEEGVATCKMVFYERTKIKSLIFLIVDLRLTDQKDIISEMGLNINQLKESNRHINTQLATVKNQLSEKEILLSAALSTSDHLKRQFMQGVKLIENSSSQTLDKIEKYICNKVDNLNKRYDKLLSKINLVRQENKYKENIYEQTLFQLEQFKRDNEKNYKMIDSLKAEMNILDVHKKQSEKILDELKQNLVKKNKDIDDLNMQITILRKDIQDATIIIAQKTKTYDEIAKDLVQANTMLVNFNKQYDFMAKETDRLRGIVVNKDQIIDEQKVHLKCLNDEFKEYKKKFSFEDMNDLQIELRKSKERIEELEKCNREAAKINGLLTKKLATGDAFESTRNQNYMYPK